MTSPDNLLAAIIADPANNDLRMVFADLLDDRGEGERAEFVRVQCELWEDFPVEKPKALGSEERYERWGLLRDANDKLLFWKAREWVQEIFPDLLISHWSAYDPIPYVISGPDRYINVKFSRGFISSVTCTYDDWARHADSITARCPIERVVLMNKKPEYVERDPGFDRWTFYLSEIGGSSIHIPLALWCEMPKTYYPTEAAALAALEQAALLYARQTEPAMV